MNDMKPPILGVVSASQWPTLFDCSLRYYFTAIRKFRSPGNGNAALGTAVHASTAVYDKAVVEGRTPSVEEAEQVAVDAINKPAYEVVWNDDDAVTRKNAEPLALAMTRSYIATQSPAHTFRAVEVKCRSLDIGTPWGVIRITGTTDRVREKDGQLGISDVKTGKNVVGKGKVKTGGHHLQTGIYKLMAEYELGRRMELPDEIIGVNATSNAPTGTGECADSRTPLIGTEDHPGLIEIAARMLKEGVFPPNPRSFMCSAKYCPAYKVCKYHS